MLLEQYNSLNQFVRSPLDEGWVREEDERGKLVYHYKPDNITTKLHPHLNRLKSTLYYLRSQIDVKEETEAAIQRKKDIELIENSKRALKQSLFRGTATKLPKAGTFKTLTDIKKVQSRNQIPTVVAPTNSIKEEPNKDNKMLVYLLNNINEEKDPLPLPGSRHFLVDAQLGLMEEVRIVKTNAMLDNIKQREYHSGVTIVESFYIDSQKYYEREFGFPLKDIPKELLNGAEFKKITVERALNIFKWFYLSPGENALFYHALLLDALPLPPDISEVKTETGIEYHYNGHCIKNVLRPAYFFVKDVLGFLKAKTDITRSRIEQFILFDSVGRPFSINLRRVFSEWLRHPDHRNTINYTQLSEGIGSFLKQDQQVPVEKMSELEKYRTDNLRRIREIMGQNYSIELSTEITSSS